MRYVFGLHGVGNAFSQVGTLAHSILEQYAKGELKISEMANQFQIRFPKEVTETFPKFFKDLKEIYYKGTLSYFKNFKGLCWKIERRNSLLFLFIRFPFV